MLAQRFYRPRIRRFLEQARRNSTAIEFPYTPAGKGLELAV
jgi:hypothetical protein